MAVYDLTSILSCYLDSHMILPLLEFLAMKKIYDEKELLQYKFDLLEKSNMLDFAMDVHRTLCDDTPVPQTMMERRENIVKQYEKYQREMEPIIKIFQDPEVTKQIQSSRESRSLLEFLVSNYDFQLSMIDTVYNYAKFQYECGNYHGAGEYLYFHRILISPNDKNYLNGLWGKLAADILMQYWDVALDELNRLKDYTENNTFGSSLQSLQQRTWLIHWSLFVFFNHVNGKEHIVDIYLNAIQTMCPHVLRYLATAVIINKQRRRVMMKDLITVIQQESYTYRDPITEFLEHLYVNFDFDGAQQKLRECETVLINDFFLVACLDSFIENARLMIFETFCQIHQCISISMLAEKLNMSPDEAEHWIVNMIRNAHLDAKIDSKAGHVVMGTQAVSPYHTLIEKTRALSFRSQMLELNIEKKLSARNQGSSQWDGPEL